MADLLTARDKLPQIEQQVRAAEMERFVLGIRAQFAPDPLAENADAFQQAAFQSLTSEAESSLAAIIVWDRKLHVLRPIYDALKAEVDAQAKTAVKPAA